MFLSYILYRCASSKANKYTAKESREYSEGCALAKQDSMVA